MKSQPIGIATSEVEVLNISPRGFGLWLEPQEYFLSFEDFPWFQSATIAQICHVVRVSEDHLYWPDLEVDLHRESLEHPGRFPLKASG